MDPRNLLLIGLLIAADISNVSTQCQTEKQTSTKDESQYWEEDIIDLENMMKSLLDYIRLIREQIWLFDSGVVITQTNDKSCALLAEGIDLDQINANITKDWSLPMMTSVLIIHDKILIKSKTQTTLVSKSQFGSLVTLLGMNDRVDMHLDPHIVFLLSGTERILTNFRAKDRNSCILGSIAQNMQHALNRILTNLDLTWKKSIKAVSLFGQDEVLKNLSACLGTEHLTLEFLLLTDSSNFEFCSRGIFQQYRSEKRNLKKRDIGVGSLVFGNGREILNLETNLHGAITSFNKNFQKLEEFDNEMVSNIQILQQNLANIDDVEQFLEEKLVEVELIMHQKHQHFKFLFIKTQQVSALGDILKHSLIEEQLDLLQRSLFHKNICTFEFCELSITSQIDENKVIVHRKLLNLKPSLEIYVTCAAATEHQVPTLHGKIASVTSQGNLLIDGKIIIPENLQNNTFVNEYLRPLLSNEIV